MTGAEPGPGTFREPALPPEPQHYQRGYLDEGHAAPSPQSGPPNTPPLPMSPPGAVVPLNLDGAIGVSGAGPGVAGIAAHHTQAGMFRPVAPPAGMGERSPM